MIYQIIENLDNTYGGPAKSVPYLAKYLTDLGFDQKIFSIRLKKNEKNEIIAKYKLSWESFDAEGIKKLRYSSSLAGELSRIHNHQKKHLLHVHNLWNFIPYIAYKISIKKGIPYVISPRGSLYPWAINYKKYRKLFSWNVFQKKVLESAACIHATDISEVEAIRHLGIKNDIALIPNGIDINEFSSNKNKIECKQVVGLNPQRKYIIFMSRIHPKKGLHFLAQSFAEISHKYKDVDLLIAGPIEDRAYFQKVTSIIDRFGLNKRFNFLGFLEGEKRIDYLNAADYFILPTHSENFGIAIAEALAAGLPVITTDGTPWKEIEGESAGYIIKLSTENLTKAIINILKTDKEDYLSMSTNASNIAARYHWSIQADKMSQLYNWILGFGEKPEFINLGD